MDRKIPSYYEAELRRIKAKNPTVLVVSFGSVRGTMDRASSSTQQAILHFRDAFDTLRIATGSDEIYDPPTIDHYQMADTYNNNMQDDWCVRQFKDHCKYYLRQDYDQIIKRDHIVKLYEYMEANPDVFMVSPRCNGRDGHPLSFNDDYKRLPMWLPFEGNIRVSKYVSYNAALFRTSMFKEMEPPYFQDQEIDGKRLDGIATINHKSNLAGLKKVMMYDCVVGHMREVENWPEDNEVLFTTACRQKVLR